MENTILPKEYYDIHTGNDIWHIEYGHNEYVECNRKLNYGMFMTIHNYLFRVVNFEYYDDISLAQFDIGFSDDFIKIFNHDEKITAIKIRRI